MKKLCLLFLLLLSFALSSCFITIGGNDPGDKACSHDWGEPVVKEATCQEAGKETYTCKLCGEKKEVVLDALDHHVFDEENVQTVKKSGVKYLRYSCIYCDYTEDVPENPDACVHVWGEGEVTTAATCKAAGVKTYTCALCSETKQEQIPPISTHTWDAGVIQTPATCKAEGTKVFTCSVCGNKRMEPIAKPTSHSWDAGTVTTAATCKASGVRTYTCKICGEKKTSDIAKLTSHTWGAVKVTKAATCTAAGSGTYTCTVCGTTKTEPILAAGHVYELGTEMTSVFHYTDWDDTPSLFVNLDNSKDSGNHTATEVTRKGTYLLMRGMGNQPTSNCKATDLLRYTFSSLSGDQYVFAVSLASPSSPAAISSTWVSLYDASGNEYPLISIGRNTGIVWTCLNNGVADTDESIGTLGDDWMDIAVVINPKSGKIDYYVNGTLSATKSVTLPSTFSKIVLGRGTTATDSYIDLDNFSFYKGSVNANALNQIFKANNRSETEYPTLNYDADGYLIVKAATCAETGTSQKTCSVCGETVTKSTPKLTTHVIGSYRITKDATETEPGQKTGTCQFCGATVTETIPAIGTGHVWSNAPVLVTEPTASTPGKYYVFCTDCGARKATGTTKSYSDYTNEINTLKSAISAVSLGTSYSKMSTSAYNAPAKYPTARVAAHDGYPSSPRVLMNADDIERLRETFADPATGDILISLVETAGDYTSGKLGSMTSHSSSDGYGPRGKHNCDEHILNTAICQALLYQITGTESYGYQAVRLIKEYISTVKIYKDVNDACRTYGNVMFSAAIVYDWCRDLLSENDKKQIIYGVEKNLCSGYLDSSYTEKKMEVGFPPSGQSPVAGHGSERQILRDYLSFAIAIYDDEPTWYQYIAGRVYQDFVPVRNVYYSAGYTPQGISNYLQIRYSSDLWSAWLLQSATGENPYNAEDMKNVMPSIYANFVNGTTFVFEEGDEEIKSAREKTRGLALASMMSAYLFDDPISLRWAEDAEYAYIASPYLFLLKSGMKVKPTSSRYAGIDYITYNGGFESRILAHNDWTKYDAAVFMKIGNRMTANHDHADAGSFQIYYKALLTGDSGCYDSYGSSHHTGYHQATVAHNSILIYNGSKSYGQNQPGESGSASNWLTNNNYKTGTTTGVDYAYDQSGKPLYAYIAGELSGCYNPSAGASRVERRMLTVYDTEDSSAPMFFFVFDAIKTSSTSYEKAFLLHTPVEPTISGNTVTVVNGSGKLVLQNVTGNSIRTKGQYSVDSGTKSSSDNDEMWGRVEITTSGAQESYMLNAMYVTDSSKNPSITAVDISNDVVSATRMGAVVAAFVKSADRRTASFSVTTGGSGDLNYYVSGVAAGTWKITVGGKTVTATATEDGGILSFTAPAGTATFTKQ